MMCSDRREDPQGGLLLYLRDPNMKTVPATYSHKRGMSLSMLHLSQELIFIGGLPNKCQANGFEGFYFLKIL